MSTITKEWLQQKIADMEEHRDLFPGDLDDDHGKVLAAFRIALASLEAEPAIHRWRRVTVEPYGPYPWHYGTFIGFSKPVNGIEDEYFYSATPAPANAEPAAWLWSHRKHPSEVTLVRPEDDERAEGAHWSGWSCQALYAEPSSPVSVPDDEQCKPHPVMAVKGELGFLDHLERIIDERDDDIEIGRLSSSNGEALMLAALDAFRAAMLQGGKS